MFSIVDEVMEGSANDINEKLEGAFGNLKSSGDDKKVRLSFIQLLLIVIST